MTGQVWKFGDNVDTDVIIPARRLTTNDPQILARYCMEDADEAFAGLVNKGDILLAGENFGCGSSREHAPIAIRAVGISCVIAKSFARIFYRNAFNIGLPTIECADIDKINSGDHIKVDFANGEILHMETGSIYKTSHIPPFMRELIQDGGLIPHLAKGLRKDAGEAA